MVLKFILRPYGTKRKSEKRLFEGLNFRRKKQVTRVNMLHITILVIRS